MSRAQWTWEKAMTNDFGIQIDPHTGGSMLVPVRRALYSTDLLGGWFDWLDGYFKSGRSLVRKFCTQRVDASGNIEIAVFRCRWIPYTNDVSMFGGYWDMTSGWAKLNLMDEAGVTIREKVGYSFVNDEFPPGPRYAPLLYITPDGERSVDIYLRGPWLPHG